MNSKLTHMLATVVLCHLCMLLSAQYPAIKAREQDTELRKGLHFLNDGPAAFSVSDIETINAFDFERYRKDDRRVEIQLVKGPLIELLSKNELLNKSLNTDNRTVTNGLGGITDANKTYSIILQLNIGLGYHKKQHTEVIN